MKQPVSDPATTAKPAKRDTLRKSTPKIANLFLWFLFCGLTGTGLLLAYRLPPGSRGGHGLSALGWTRHEWGDLHFWISIAFLILLTVHLALHWRWFWQIASKRRAWPLLAGIGAGVALMIGMMCLPVKRAETREHAAANHEPETRTGKQFRGGK
jgi:hypothetical protein